MGKGKDVHLKSPIYLLRGFSEVSFRPLFHESQDGPIFELLKLQPRISVVHPRVHVRCGQVRDQLCDRRGPPPRHRVLAQPQRSGGHARRRLGRGKKAMMYNCTSSSVILEASIYFSK